MTFGGVGATIECQVNVVKERRSFLRSESGESFSVTYKLVRIDIPYTLFIIAAECNGENAGACVGGSGEMANEIFSLIAEGGVMPSVLAETLAEFEK